MNDKILAKKKIRLYSGVGCVLFTAGLALVGYLIPAGRSAEFSACAGCR